MLKSVKIFFHKERKIVLVSHCCFIFYFIFAVINVNYMDASLINKELSALYKKYRKYVGFPQTDNEPMSLPSFVECVDEYANNGNKKMVFVLKLMLKGYSSSVKPKNLINHCINHYRNLIKTYYQYKPVLDFAEFTEDKMCYNYVSLLNEEINPNINPSFVVLSDKPLGNKPSDVNECEFHSAEIDFLQAQLNILKPDVVIVLGDDSVVRRLGNFVSYYPLPLPPSFIKKYEEYNCRSDLYKLDGIMKSEAHFYSCGFDFYTNDGGDFERERIDILSKIIISNLE